MPGETRWQLRRAVAAMNRWFEAAGLQQHPDKTFIGRISKGFDWLGYDFDAQGLCGIAARAVMHATARFHSDRRECRYQKTAIEGSIGLYEQARRQTTPEGAWRRAVDYLRRWQRWCRDGLGRNAVAILDHANPWDVMIPAGMAGA